MSSRRTITVVVREAADGSCTVELPVLGLTHADSGLDAALIGLAEKTRAAIHETLGDPYAFAAAREAAVELAAADADGRLGRALLEAAQRA
jgi:hypothetical protein